MLIASAHFRAAPLTGSKRGVSVIELGQYFLTFVPHLPSIRIVKSKGVLTTNQAQSGCDEKHSWTELEPDVMSGWRQRVQGVSQMSAVVLGHAWETFLFKN